MRVLVERQCDVIFAGRGPVDGRKRALFPGQVYDLDTVAVKALIDSGHVRVLEVEGHSQPVAAQRRRRS